MATARDQPERSEESEAAASGDSLAAVWPIVGRDDTLARIQLAIEGDLGGLVLTGPAGVGKSRVARRALIDAQRRGAPVEWIQATDANRDLPLGAFGFLLPKDRSSTTPLDLLRRTATVLQQRGGRRRLVLVVDDAHLLDPASATLVHQLASSGGVFVLATLRTGEDAPDAVVALWKDGLAERVELGVLDEDDVGAVLRAALGSEVQLATVHRLWAATQGNPLFLHELALAGISSNALRREDGVWAWRGPIADGGRLRDVLEARLAPLTDRERRALTLLAVGEPLGIDVFERLVGIDVVDRLERQELLVIRRAERREEASLSHPLYRELLRVEMSDAERADAQERLALAIEQAGRRRRGDQLRIAMWRLSGHADADPALLVAAAAEAEARFDAELAERLARAAVDRDGGARAWHAVAASLRAQGRWIEADEAWATAFDLETDPAERVTLAQSRSANLFFGLGAGSRAIEVLEGVFTDATTPALRDTIASLVAMFDLYRGRIDASLVAVLPILERAEVRADARIDAALTASAAYALRGRADDAIAVVDDNLALALQDPEVGSIAAGALMATRLLAQALDGRLSDAYEAARVVYDLAVEMGTHDGIAALSFAIGQIHVTRGDIAAARRHLADGSSLLREHDRNGYLPWCLAELAYAELLAGHVDDAAAIAADMDRVDRPELRLFWPRVDTVKLLLLGLERPDEAIDGLLAMSTAAIADGHLMLAGMALHDGLRLGGANRVAEPLARLAIATDSQLLRAFASHARAAASGDGQSLDAVSTTFESMGALLFAAEAADRAAAAHAGAGANAARAAAARRSAALLARCDGAAPPWTTVDLDDLTLSGRQLEVARLAAEGLSSRAIAERLFVSVRTVDNHLYRIYARLGVSSREELAVVLESDAAHSDRRSE